MAASDQALAGPKAAALALHRFGFGPAAGQIEGIGSDPRGALLADLDRAAAGTLTVDLPSSAQAARAVFDFQAERRAQQKLALRAQKADETSGEMQADANQAMSEPAKIAGPNEEHGPKQPPLPQALLLNEAKARFDAATGAEIGFVERLAWFWSNHFCVSADKIVAMAGPYEREAIRPHVLGHFGDLLRAVDSHPAMLFYLDNVESMGPDSIAGIDRDKGLNENLARETLELHTLGVRSGYTQTDVTSFAKVLTGWTWFPPSEPESGGEFVFNKLLHEPGPQTVLGKSYAEAGIDQGRALLADLARHPATARHMAQQLASHFIADTPPPTLVDKLTRTFKDSDGNLKEVAKTLINADESWTAQRQKLKTPAVWVASLLRVTGAQALFPIGQIVNAQATLGEPLWRPPAPNGFSDTEAALIDGVPRRLDIANAFAARLAMVEPLALLASSIGPLASAQTRDTVAHAETRRQAVALLAMAPEFLRS
ncbi:MAG: DUF1800 family protein [Xanthobacteraceae bacterium]